MTAGARLPVRRLPANSQLERPMAAGRISFCNWCCPQAGTRQACDVDAGQCLGVHLVLLVSRRPKYRPIGGDVGDGSGGRQDGCLNVLEVITSAGLGHKCRV